MSSVRVRNFDTVSAYSQEFEQQYVPDGSMNQFVGPGTRGHTGNAYPAGAGTTPSNSVPSIAMSAPAPMPTSATPTYTYEVPPYYGP
jgi:hypothetical protein